MSLLDEIERSRKGEVITVPFIHKKLSKFIFIGKGLYHLLGGASGSGKSAWVDLNYVINPTIWYQKYGQEHDLSLSIILRSLERSKERRKAKWVCMNLYLEYGILIDVPSLLGWGMQKSKITDDLYEKIKKEYDKIEKWMDTITIVDGIENPTGIFKQFEEYALERGSLYKYMKPKGSTEENLFKIRGTSKEKVDPRACPEATPYQAVYEPDDPKHIMIGVLDHLQALKRERTYNDKENLDKMSEYNRIARDIYGMMQVVVNQMNRGISDTYRRVKTDLMPEDKDFAGSSQMYNDCDMAGILFNPYKYSIHDLKGWKIKNFTNDFGINRFRSYHLLKNTYGPDNQIFGYNFIGENGIFRELPKPTHMTDEIYNKARVPPREILISKYVD